MQTDIQLMSKGLESVFDNKSDVKDKFEKEKNFGKKLYVTAWAVEILAACLGLCIAFFMAYDAYNASETKDLSTFINALLGALPFLLIAIIEPTKIPLAGGLYKIRHLGWKTLIFFALIGLTLVTFETIFTGLERQVTNVTAKVSRGENEIINLESKITENERVLKEYLELSIEKETQELTKKILENRRLKSEEIEEENKQHLSQIKLVENEIKSLNDRIIVIVDERKESREEQIGPLSQVIESLTTKISDLENQKNDLNKKIEGLSATDSSTKQIQIIENQISEINNNIEKNNNYLSSKETENIKKAQVNIGVTDDGKIGPNTMRNFELWKNQQNNKIKDLQNKILNIRKDENTDKNNRRDKLELEISKLDKKIDKIEKERSDYTLERKNLQQNTAKINFDDTEKNLLLENIKNNQKKIMQLNKEKKINIDNINFYREEREKDFEKKSKGIEDQVNKSKNEIPKLRELINTNTQEINRIKQDLRIEAQKNQIYRFAQKLGGHDDILEVNEKELTFVASIWFGSIALICATIGTILAIISYIMTDPEAFVQKQKLKIDNPLRRSMRRFFLALRKRIFLKPKRIEVPVEVEKVVEVEKEVEIEKIVEVEKEVIKEVPVEKVKIQEVPVEVIRRELVHVPFYATESGLVDASDHLKKIDPVSKDLLKPKK